MVTVFTKFKRKEKILLLFSKESSLKISKTAMAACLFATEISMLVSLKKILLMVKADSNFLMATTMKENSNMVRCMEKELMSMT